MTLERRDDSLRGGSVAKWIAVSLHLPVRLVVVPETLDLGDDGAAGSADERGASGSHGFRGWVARLSRKVEEGCKSSPALFARLGRRSNRAFSS